MSLWPATFKEGDGGYNLGMLVVGAVYNAGNLAAFSQDSPDISIYDMIYGPGVDITCTSSWDGEAKTMEHPPSSVFKRDK